MDRWTLWCFACGHFCISYTVLLGVALIFVENGKCIPVALSVKRLLDNGFEKGFSICSKFGALHPLFYVIKSVVISCGLIYFHKLGSKVAMSSHV